MVERANKDKKFRNELKKKLKRKIDSFKNEQEKMKNSQKQALLESVQEHIKTLTNKQI
jgi:F0F1-type ATP synthase assembly protein I